MGGRVQETTSDVKRGRGEEAAAVGQWAPAARSALTMVECPLSSANCKADFPYLISKNIVRSKINKTKWRYNQNHCLTIIVNNRSLNRSRQQHRRNKRQRRRAHQQHSLVLSMHVRAPSNQKLQTRQRTSFSCLVNRSLTTPAATSMRHSPSLSQHNTQQQPRQPITPASNNQHPQHSSSTLNKTQHATAIPIAAIGSIAATSGNVVALINSTHLV